MNPRLPTAAATLILSFTALPAAAAGLTDGGYAAVDPDQGSTAPPGPPARHHRRDALRVHSAGGGAQRGERGGEDDRSSSEGDDCERGVTRPAGSRACSQTAQLQFGDDHVDEVVQTARELASWGISLCDGA